MDQYAFALIIQNYQNTLKKTYFLYQEWTIRLMHYNQPNISQHLMLQVVFGNYLYQLMLLIYLALSHHLVVTNGEYYHLVIAMRVLYFSERYFQPYLIIISYVAWFI